VEQRTVITSDSLEYVSSTRIYIARGSVVIERDEAVIRADQVTFDERTSDVVAVGSVFYEDDEALIKASRAEMNIESKTGILYSADLFYKKENYHVYGERLEKRGRGDYYSHDASFTTCDAPVPAWCFHGKKVNAIMEKDLKARGVTFRIKNIPVMYSPYLWVPLVTKRKTGLLLPTAGYSKSRGAHLKVPFFWAISDDRDATFIVDTYSKRGIGAGLEYRFVKPGGITSYWWTYYIRDTELDRDFWEFRALHENRYPGNRGGFLSINYLNKKDFYREFISDFDIRIQRFLESTGEINVPFENSRLYFLSQYWVDLKNDTGDVPQKLPEVGYILNYRKSGGIMASASLTAAHMWRDKGLSAGRLDVYPKLVHTLGKDISVTQSVALRGTAYSFYNDDSKLVSDSSEERIAFEYDIVGHTRLSKKYSSFMHVLEPSLRYLLVSSSDYDLPVFDSTDLVEKTSRFELSLFNRLISGGIENATVRITQGYEAENGDRPFLPLKLDIGMGKPIPLKAGAAFDVHTGDVVSASSDLSFRFSDVGFRIGLRYNKDEELMLYKGHVAYNPLKALQISGGLWYDAKGGGLRDMTVNLRYMRQCWGIKSQFTKQPGDYSVTVNFELIGIN
jgi:LPS-assembly protein